MDLHNISQGAVCERRLSVCKMDYRYVQKRGPVYQAEMLLPGLVSVKQ